MSPATCVHATLVAIRGQGVLIRGAARSGKTSLALCLLRAAARESLAPALIADDQVLLHADGQDVTGSCPPTIAGLIEISGAGILRLPHAGSASLRLVVELADNPPRLPESPAAEVCGHLVRRIFLPPRAPAFGADVVLTLFCAPGGFSIAAAQHDAISG